MTQATRAAAPELSTSGVVDVPDDEDGDDDGHGDTGGGGPFITHTLVAVVDGAALSRSAADAAADAVRAAASGLPPGGRLGVAAVGSGLALIDSRGCGARGGATRAALRVLPLVGGDTGPPALLDAGDALPLAAFLAPAGGGDGAARADAAAAAAAAASGGGDGARALGPALQALLAYAAAGVTELDAEGSDGDDDDEGVAEERQPGALPPPPAALHPPPPPTHRLAPPAADVRPPQRGPRRGRVPVRCRLLAGRRRRCRCAGCRG